MSKQGKCSKCKTYFYWDKDTPLKKLCCPKCAPSRNRPLERTTRKLGMGKNPKYIRQYQYDNPPLKELYLRKKKQESEEI